MSRTEIKQSVKGLGLNQYFTFTGMLNAEAYKPLQLKADAMIVCAIQDPMYEYVIPGKVYSYMIAGKPLIAAMDGAAAELINQRAKSGICVNSENSQALAKTIIRFSKLSKSTQTEFGRNGFEYSQKYWNTQQTNARIEKFLLDYTLEESNEYSAE
jgi:glycosyltransferase involved in cell wall biosynthesis